jgi:hypothetical protein
MKSLDENCASLSQMFGTANAGERDPKTGQDILYRISCRAARYRCWHHWLESRLRSVAPFMRPIRGSLKSSAEGSIEDPTRLTRHLIKSGRRVIAYIQDKPVHRTGQGKLGCASSISPMNQAEGFGERQSQLLDGQLPGVAPVIPPSRLFVESHFRISIDKRR